MSKCGSLDTRPCAYCQPWDMRRSNTSCASLNQIRPRQSWFLPLTCGNATRISTWISFSSIVFCNCSQSAISIEENRANNITLYTLPCTIENWCWPATLVERYDMHDKGTRISDFELIFSAVCCLLGEWYFISLKKTICHLQI